ncbi:MAG: phosphatase PAP2 family protein [Oligoflexia bacterium]|nr:phosphatase PAP2 family protein [Oligoflexia bacterium]MBF0365182.1 phosphatase PAP2 family protein [Oligoflexia bacterium]
MGAFLIRISIFILLFSLSCFSFSLLLFAEEGSQKEEVKEVKEERPKTLCQGKLSNLLSPFCTEARSVFLYGSLLTTGIYLSRADTSNRVRINTIKEKPLKDTANVGNIIGLGFLNASYFTYQALWGNVHNAELMAEASAYTAAVTWILKHLVNERRPGNSNDTKSFPSGHTSMAFAFSSVVGARHGLGWGSLAYLTAVFIAYTRIHDDYHYLHDVVFGATLGMSYGLGIHYNHKQGHPYWVMPVPTADGKGMQLVMKIPF